MVSYDKADGCGDGEMGEMGKWRGVEVAIFRDWGLMFPQC